ncbi:chlorophyll a-b binding protein CP24 10A chloroplastic-like [Tripterygium wilfordii]|uniref:Chlorophyll a-b binding protein CP24 10A chloroplastic-like n=1 Tax=Tripterygium wilfordii TaxID=458696 RepID=A0A7J7CCP8_TRIWF|nr:chlorophyll a-b binding protein CP24 10A chloroplastic-like [Tripterygium wilfordii]
MAAATSGALLNGLGSSFLSGGKRSQAFLAGAARWDGGAIAGTRKLVVAAALQPKKSWLPGVKAGGSLVDPEWLDGS